jgi:hypothetical protein
VTAEVVLADDAPNGLAEMLAGLIRANLDRRPERSALLRPAVVEIAAADAGVEVTVRLRPGVVEVENGPANPGSDVAIVADARDLLELSAAPLRLGLPDPVRRDGRAVLVLVLRRRVRIAGLLRHPIALSRFARLLSAR